MEDRFLSPRDIRELAAELDLNPTKRLGQNFVIDPNTVRRIVDLSEFDPGDCVLEIGPGLGSLTIGLLSGGANVVAIEIDSRLASRLPQTVEMFAPSRAAHLRVVGGDAMTIDLPREPTAVIANLPYNVAVPVVLRVFGQLPNVKRGLVMVQLEVARRLAASPGSPDYGIPSVKMQWFGQVEVAGRVSPKVFWPEPRVDSGLVRIRRGDPPVAVSTRQQVFACIDAGFSQRRKKLRSALADWAGSTTNADQILDAAGVSRDLRAEDLTLVDFVRIADARLAATGA